MNARRLLPSIIATTFGVLVFASAQALAASPLEAPEITLSSPVPATTASLQGVLNPKSVSEAGTYEFLYKQGKAGCTGGSAAPVPAGLLIGVEHQEVFETLSGLTANTEYSVCLRAENTTTHEVALSPVVTFTTALPPEKPETLSPAKSITATTAVLEGVLNPHSEMKAGWYFLISTGPECASGSASALEPEVTGKAVHEHAEVSLEPHTKYVFCMVASDAAGDVAESTTEVSFETPAAAPVILSESAPTAVTASTARLEGVVNPDNEATECHIEYVLASFAEHLVPCEQLIWYEDAWVPAPTLSFVEGEGTRPIEVGVSLAGLTQRTTYHYRILVKNATGTAEGEENEFTTDTPEVPETTAVTEVGPFSAKLNGVLNPNHVGEAGAYEFVYRESPTECQGKEEAATSGVRANGLSPEPVSEVLTVLPGTTYTVCLRALNGAGESALGNPVSFSTPPVAPVVSEEFADEDSAGSAALHAHVNPGGTETTYRFEYGTTTSYGTTIPGDVGSGPVAIPVKVALQALAPNTLYHYRLVAGNAIDKEAAGPDRTFTTQPAGATFSLPDGRAWEMVSPPNKKGAEVFNAKTGAGGDFQAAENGDAITYITNAPISTATRSNPWEPQVMSRRGPNGWYSEDLSIQHDGSSTREYVVAKEGSFAPRAYELEEYQAFSPDLEYAYSQPEAHTPLVPGQPATERNQELNVAGYTDGYVRDNATGTFSITHFPQAVEWYAEQVALAQAPPTCNTSTSPAKGVGIDAVSKDGCYVYFNSAAILAPGATGPEPLYVSHYENGGWKTTFISSLSGTGAPEWSGRYWELSPGGRYVAFMSNLSLTGFDNHDAASGQPDEEVYLYDAVENRLACASCNRDGTRPTGQFDNSPPGTFVSDDEVLVDSNGEWTGHWLAGILPQWSLEGVAQYEPAIYQPRYVFDSGRLFFDSPDALVPQDANGLENVYEYEPEGIGSCGSPEGCVSLLSSGTSDRESAFVDASLEGNDAFFITRSRLVQQDVDNSYDMYDAHLCSAGVPCNVPLVSPPPCETSDACKAPPSPQSPNFGAPASSTFSGAGNVAKAAPITKPRVKLKAGSQKCRKGLRKEHGRCVKQKTKSKAKKSSRRSK